METSVIENGMWVPSSALVLALVLGGMGVLLWLQVKDLKNSWFQAPDARVRFPRKEQLSWKTRILDAIARARRDQYEIHTAINSLAEDRELYSSRIRKEIDKLVGRDEYQGKKEQL